MKLHRYLTCSFLKSSTCFFFSSESLFQVCSCFSITFSECSRAFLASSSTFALRRLTSSLAFLALSLKLTSSFFSSSISALRASCSSIFDNLSASDRIWCSSLSPKSCISTPTFDTDIGRLLSLLQIRLKIYLTNNCKFSAKLT